MQPQTITVKYHASNSGYQIKIHDILEVEENNQKKFLVFSLITPPKGTYFSTDYIEQDSVTLEVDEKRVVEEPAGEIFDIFTYEKKLAPYQSAKSVYHVDLDESIKKAALFDNCFFSERRQLNHKYQKLSETLTLDTAAANKKSFPELYLRFKDILNLKDESESETLDQKLKKLEKFQGILNILIQMQHAYYDNNPQQLNAVVEARQPANGINQTLDLMRACRDYKGEKYRKFSDLTNEILELLQTNMDYLHQKQAQLSPALTQTESQQPPRCMN